MWGTAIAVTAFWALRPRPVVVHNTTYYVTDDGQTYQPVEQDGETKYAQISPPVDYEVESLPADAVELYVDDQYYWYAQSTGGFYVEIAREGKKLFVVVDPPPGAFVKDLPENTRDITDGEDEDDDEVYQFADTYFVEAENEEEEAGYVVTAPPAPDSTELAELPEDTIRLELGGVTYYYFSGEFYIRDTAAGENIYTVSEPPMGATASTLPDGAIALTEEGSTFFQFDMLFFEQVPGGGFKVVEEPAGSPEPI